VRIFAVGDNLVFDLAGQGKHEGNYNCNRDINNTAAQNFQKPMRNGCLKLSIKDLTSALLILEEMYFTNVLAMDSIITT
jgi:hypothetical protein